MTKLASALALAAAATCVHAMTEDVPNLSDVKWIKEEIEPGLILKYAESVCAPSGIFVSSR